MTFEKGNTAFLGHKHTKEAKLKLSQARSGKFSKGTGFKKGHTINIGRVRSEETRKKMSESKKGVGVGRTPWNKGRSCSEETRKKISEKRKGIPSWNKGKHLSEEHKIKLSERHKGMKMPSFTEKHKIKISNSHKGKIPSKETKERIAHTLKGKYAGNKSPQWRGGISFLPYCSKFNRQLKERIRERDNRICQLCGEKENGERLICHHIHYDKPNCEPDLISLCRSCNAKANFNRDYYEALFIQKLKDRGLI